MKICLVLFALFYVAFGQNTTDTTTVPGTKSSSTAPTVPPKTTSDSTTTMAPKTTDSTTTNAPKTTNSTTTNAPKTTDSTTVTPPETTPGPTAPLTTVSPSYSTTNTYNYTENGTVCLLAEFASHFAIKNETLNVTVAAQVNDAKSGCGKLSVDFGENTFTIMFSQTEKKAFYIAEVKAHLMLNNKSIDAKAENLTLGKASNASSYMCLSGLNIEMNHGVTFHMTKVQLQAYYVKDGKFATALTCTADFPNNTLVPIAVGCALGGLIVVVLVAYCILRSRANQKYDPVDNTI